jgi:hypothetical protein
MGIIEKKRRRIRSFQKPDLLGLAGVAAELLWGSMAPAGRQGEQA